MEDLPASGEAPRAGKPIAVTNPLSLEHALLRQSLVGSLVEKSRVLVNSSQPPVLGADGNFLFVSTAGKPQTVEAWDLWSRPPARVWSREVEAPYCLAASRTNRWVAVRSGPSEPVRAARRGRGPGDGPAGERAPPQRPARSCDRPRRGGASRGG